MPKSKENYWNKFLKIIKTKLKKKRIFYQIKNFNWKIELIYKKQNFTNCLENYIFLNFILH